VAVGLIAVLGARRLPAAEAASLPPCFEQLSEHPLPEVLEWARDVRWTGERSLYLSTERTGVFKVELDEPEKEPELEIPSADRLVVGSLMFALGWTRLGSETFEAQEYFEFVVDLDVRGDEILILGMRKNEEGSAYASNGAYVWLASPGEEGLENLRPLAFSSYGSTSPAFGGCAGFLIGAARFLDDGSFVVAPVSERDVFLYRADGTLERSWRSEELGFDGGCDLSPEQIRLGIFPDPQQAWINARRVVDDVLVLDGRRFGLIVREYRDGLTRWVMRTVAPEGPSHVCDVGIEAMSPWVHLRVDRRGEHIALVQITKVHEHRKQLKPLVAPRLLVGRLGESVKPIYAKKEE
jgi:hypothetical protein